MLELKILEASFIKIFFLLNQKAKIFVYNWHGCITRANCVLGKHRPKKIKNRKLENGRISK